MDLNLSRGELFILRTDSKLTPDVGREVSANIGQIQR